jgi:Zn-dependent M28 family amino/carboxypeptidase
MRTLRTVVICALALATTIAGVGVAPAQDEVNTSRLRRAVGVPGILQHLKEFQEIADDHGDARSAGTRGYKASVDYVAQRLRKAGYKVQLQNFSFNRFEENSPAEFERVSPNAETYTADDFLSMEYSGSGEVTANLGAVDLLLPPTGGSTSGCEAGDFAGFPAGSIALIQRGTCTFREKADNAAAAGAVGVVIFNEGNDPGRTGVLGGTLSPPDEEADVPVVGTSFAVGEELANLLQGGPVTVRLKVDAEVITTESTNVLADTKTGNKDRTIVVGAHLDSVPEGPGINDNGSGTAVLLEIAEEMARLKIKPENRVRFAFWGAEESGLIGSTHYVDNLSDQEFAQIALNLNFDMLGSPNYVRFVYDGDGSDTPDSGPDGSGLIEDVFLDYFASQNLETEPTAFDGRSDYRPFILAGIPAGGLFSGAEVAKTDPQEDVYGGVAGLAYDPCYHQACDTLVEKKQSDDVEAVEDAYGNNVIVGNVNRRSLGELGDAAAHATLFFAERTDDISDAAARRAGARRQAEMDYIGPFAVR